MAIAAAKEFVSAFGKACRLSYNIHELFFRKATIAAELARRFERRSRTHEARALPTDLRRQLVPAAEELFREIRLENVFHGVDGEATALTGGAQLTITFEADIAGTVPMNP